MPEPEPALQKALNGRILKTKGVCNPLAGHLAFDDVGAKLDFRILLHGPSSTPCLRFEPRKGGWHWSGQGWMFWERAPGMFATQ